MKHAIKKQPRALMIVLAVIMLTTSACPTCKEILALADLAIQALKAPQKIGAGEAFDVVSDIINEEKAGDCTVTDIANSTKNLLQVFFDDGSTGYQLVGELADIAQGDINPGDILSLIQNLTLNWAGNFRFDYYDDVVDLVDERDETNNYDYIYGSGRPADQLTQMKLTNNFKSVYVKVLPLPDGTTKIPNKPIVEFN